MDAQLWVSLLPFVAFAVIFWALARLLATTFRLVLSALVIAIVLWIAVGGGRKTLCAFEGLSAPAFFCQTDGRSSALNR